MAHGQLPSGIGLTRVEILPHEARCLVTLLSGQIQKEMFQIFHESKLFDNLVTQSLEQTI